MKSLQAGGLREMLVRKGQYNKLTNTSVPLQPWSMALLTPVIILRLTKMASDSVITTPGRIIQLSE
jgi:hypothetical protein